MARWVIYSYFLSIFWTYKLLVWISTFSKGTFNLCFQFSPKIFLQHTREYSENLKTLSASFFNISHHKMELCNKLNIQTSYSGCLSRQTFISTAWEVWSGYKKCVEFSFTVYSHSNTAIYLMWEFKLSPIGTLNSLCFYNKGSINHSKIILERYRMPPIIENALWTSFHLLLVNSLCFTPTALPNLMICWISAVVVIFRWPPE